jgi:hypothetical protein
MTRLSRVCVFGTGPPCVRRLRKAVAAAVASSRSSEHEIAARLNENMLAKVGDCNWSAV